MIILFRSLLALKLSPGDIMTALLEPLRKQLRDDITNNTDNGWKTLMTFDGMTMTQFLSRYSLCTSVFRSI